MEASHRWRLVEEDADEAGECFVPMPSGVLDALDFAVAPEDTWPAWICDPCGQRWPGFRVVCGLCGTTREDIDACA